MSRLIFFSGGVESTAMLSIADPQDQLVTVVWKNGWYAPSVDMQKSKKIAQEYGFEPMIVSIEFSKPERAEFVHQMDSFVTLGNMLVKAYGFTEVWSGLHSAEPNPKSKPYHERTLRAWDVLCPEARFVRPLIHLSKKHQWDLIPEHIKPLVVTCAVHDVFHSGCGKCEERKGLFHDAH